MEADQISVYETVRDELVAQLRTLSPEQSLQVVPSCPEWSIKDVVAHVAGLVADIRDGVEPPLGTDENTSRQVSTRADMTLAEICDEWMSNVDGMATLTDRPARQRTGLLADLTVHVFDLAEMDDPPFSSPTPSTQR